MVANTLVHCWYQVKPKQWRTVGVAELLKASIFQRDLCVLTACPRAEQIPSICDELTGHWPCLKVVCLWYVSGIVSLSLHLSPCMGIFQLVLVMSFHNQDCYLIQKYLFRIYSLKVVIQYQDLWLMIIFCGYGAPWVTFYQPHWKLWPTASLCSIDA